MARTNRPCVVDGCLHPPHARGYCRRHYAQMWRYGRIVSADERADARPTDDREIENTERALEAALEMYDAVVGFPGRMRWRRRIDAMQEHLRRLKGQWA